MPRPKKIILVVDDNEQTLSIRRFLLDNAGYRVLSATSGEEALNILREGGIDILLTDLIMPNMDGNELIRRAKQIDPDVRTILISGTIKNHGHAYRADAFIPKGMPVRILLENVRVLAARKRGPKKKLPVELIQLEGAA
jgi:two-component system, OmpR family, response regulator CpxR